MGFGFPISAQTFKVWANDEVATIEDVSSINYQLIYKR
jgi:hypothetical protein